MGSTEGLRTHLRLSIPDHPHGAIEDRILDGLRDKGRDAGIPEFTVLRALHKALHTDDEIPPLLLDISREI